jgi:formylglycine-generating enzyme required for sulfatase activity
MPKPIFSNGLFHCKSSFLLMVYSWFLFSFQTFSQETLKLNGRKTQFVRIPKKNIYASKYEVTNLDYLTYLEWVKLNKSNEDFIRNLPDTLCWESPLSYMDNYINYYFRHPAYRDYPVVNVSYENAVSYCEFLTDYFNSKLNDKKIKKILFRLPSEEEWELAARGTLHECSQFPFEKNQEKLRRKIGSDKGSYQANFTREAYQYIVYSGSLTHGSAPTVPVESYWPNSIGVYHFAGNVSEMVQERNICKGGSWEDPSYKMVIQNRDTVIGPNRKLGFRVFVEIEEYQIKEKAIKYNSDYFESKLTFIDPMKQGNINLKNFHIYDYEVSNELYFEFINSLSAEDRKIHYPQDSLWMQETDLKQYLHYTEQFPNYPVVNISKNSMEAFCVWLTNTYNSDPKRKHKKVQVSLPTMEEWNCAARKLLHHQFFSWGGPYHINTKGVILMNCNPLFAHIAYNEIKLSSDLNYRKSQLNILRKSRDLDGYELTAPIDSYNNILKNKRNRNNYSRQNKKFERLNMHGNVAEATQDSDKVAGGSFASMVENCLIIDQHSEYFNLIFQENIKSPSPQVGFRFIFKVLE